MVAPQVDAQHFRPRYGVIRNIRSERVTPEQSGAGIAIGAIAGGAAGNKVGKGKGRKAATLLGALVGGAIGSHAEGQLRARRADELTIVFDDGGTLTITQPEQLELRIGDRVLVRSTSGELRASGARYTPTW